MGEKQAAQDLDRRIDLSRAGSATPSGAPGEDLRERMELVDRLCALDLPRESRDRERLREHLTRKMKQRSEETPAARGRPWVRRRPVLAVASGVVLILMTTAVVAPSSLAALVEPVVRLIASMSVGEHTRIIRPVNKTAEEVATIQRESERSRAAGERWHLNTRYGGFGGRVAEGATATVRRAASLEELHSLTHLPLPIPSHLHRDNPVEFDHAYVAPDGWLFMFFGSGRDELLLSMSTVGNGRVVSYGRMENRPDSAGRMVFESPELKTEEIRLGDLAATWDPDPWAPGLGRSEGSALRWEEDGISYSLMGRSLTREEAEDFLLSLRPLE